MRADNTAHLVAAARARSDAAHKRATNALRRLDQTGAPITFGAVAAEASAVPQLALPPTRPAAPRSIGCGPTTGTAGRSCRPPFGPASNPCTLSTARRCRPRSTGSPRRTADWPAKPSFSSANAERAEPVGENQHPTFTYPDREQRPTDALNHS